MCSASTTIRMWRNRLAACLQPPAIHVMTPPTANSFTGSEILRDEAARQRIAELLEQIRERRTDPRTPVAPVRESQRQIARAPTPVVLHADTHVTGDVAHLGGDAIDGLAREERRLPGREGFPGVRQATAVHAAADLPRVPKPMIHGKRPFHHDIVARDVGVLEVASRDQPEAGPTEKNVTQIDARDRAGEIGRPGGPELQGPHPDFSPAADHRAGIEFKGWQQYVANRVAITGGTEAIPNPFRRDSQRGIRCHLVLDLDAFDG